MSDLIQPQIENENLLLSAFMQTGINLFLGAGFSVLAKDKNGDPLPTGAELAIELCQEFDIQGGEFLDLSRVATIIESARRTELRRYLESRLRVAEYDSLYKVLEKLHLRSIFTTNVDNLMHLIFTDSRFCYLNDLDATGPDFSDRRAVDYVTLNGSISDPNRPLNFGSAALASAFASDPDRWHFLTHRFQDSPTIFWGYSVSDAATLHALNPTTVQGRPQENKWIVVHPSSDDVGTLQYFRALGLQIIVCDTRSMLAYLDASLGEFNLDISLDDSEAGTSINTEDLFPDALVPDPGKVPVRPILQFYLGSPPQWSDIFSGSIRKTHHFQRIQNAIHSGRNTFFVGVPACGKTTLLMQLAAEEYPSRQHRLFLGSLTVERADFIVSSLEGQSAILFIDNFADSVKAVERLIREPNIQLVGTDREYNYGIASHRIGTRAEILDVTELTEADIQGCLDKVPQSIRLPRYRRPVIRAQIEPSLFEIIDANVRGPSLRKRFASVLADLWEHNRELHDLLVMMSYVYQARVPVSMDMLFAYFRGVTSDYREISAMCTRLGQMIADYGGKIVLIDDQDYYVPRSAVVAEAVMTEVGQRSLKEVLVRFHKQVSPYRICRYDVFKMYAYDYQIMHRAFRDWREGKEFYLFLYDRDNSPYLLQQCALFLSRKKQHKEAFTMIDRANTESGGRIWSIRNSFAIILFRANISHAVEDDRDPVPRETLFESMEILKECITWDKRKPFHVLTFADFASQLWEIYGDEEALTLLENAKNWLTDEKRKSPWNRAVSRMLKETQQKYAAANDELMGW